MQNPSYLEYLFFVILSILSGLGVRFALGYAKQTWAMTYHHTMSYALLPVVTMIITVLIAGNIALSLGMIGALSIVRFRNPVKNPFELVIFFALITIGIGFATNFILGLTLTVVTILLIVVAKIYEDISKKKGKELFSLSFEEGSTVHVMEIKSSSAIKELEESENLAQSFSTKNPISHSGEVITSLIEIIAIRSPLKFVGTPGIILIILGIYFAIDVMLTYTEIGYFSIPFTLIGVSCLVVGLILFLTSILLYSLSKRSKKSENTH